MNVLKHLSFFMSLSGVFMALVGWIFALDQVVILIGVLLAWAGFVKIAVVAIWTRVAMMGTDDHRPIAGQ